MKKLTYAMMASATLLAAPAMASLPTGNYECSQSQVFQFDETGQGFGVAAVLSTDVIFSLMEPRPDSSLIYQEAGTTYLIAQLADDWSKFKFRVVYSGDLRSFTGFCHAMAEPAQDSQ